MAKKATTKKTTKPKKQSTKATKKVKTTKQVSEKKVDVNTAETKITPKATTSDSKTSNLKTKTETNKTETKNLQNSFNFQLAMPAILGLLAISIFSTFSFYVVPYQILTQTEDYKLEQEQKEIEQKRKDREKMIERRIKNEDEDLNFAENKDWVIGLNYRDFGELKFEMKEEFAPKTVENFVRLTYRGYYNETNIHRIVKNPNFAVIQGGDAENGNGTGGRSAFYIDEGQPGLIPDEIWEVEPKFGEDPESPGLTNEPKLINDTLYGEFNAETGNIEYPKGTILMAKTSDPNSASSQYFITLENTILPAVYTIFGVLQEESMPVLDKIYDEVNPVIDPEFSNPQAGNDGPPDRELVLTEARILSPEL